MRINSQQSARLGGSLLTLLHPRGQAGLFILALAAATLAASFSVTRLSLPLWAAIAGALGFLLYPAARKWQADRRQLGTPAMLLSILLASQGLHTVEHIAQWIQFNALGWPLRASSGLLSPLNAEIVHFTWNMTVLLVIAYLLASGVRNRWMWLLLVWAAAHTAEHSYLFVNYLYELRRLANAGLPLDAAQGLPGFFGKAGWLATNAPQSGPIAWICTIAPGLTDAPRLSVHFWWNMGEMALLLLAAHRAMGTIAPGATDTRRA
jgi:hypothetical protein